MTRKLSLTVNGRSIEAVVEPRMHLADFIRDVLRLTGTHLGCEHGVCGACTVLVDGAPTRSCHRVCDRVRRHRRPYHRRLR